MAGLKDVTVIINISKPTPKIGFGKPLIVGTSTTGADYKSYKSLEAVKKDYSANLEVIKAATALFGQGDNSPASIGIMLKKTADATWNEFMEKAFSQDWHFLILTSSTVENITAIADLIELDDTRQFFASTSKKEDLKTIKSKDYKNTVAFYLKNTDDYPEAAWIGETGSQDVGSVTWKFRTLSGIKPMELSASELEEIHELGANTYVTKAGDNVTSEGKTVSGEYIDVIHAKQYVTYSIEYEVQKLLNKSPKIPYTSGGIAMIESTVKMVLQRCYNQGMIASDQDNIGIYGTTFKPREDVNPTDRANREYNEGSFFFEIAGAIHTAKINGVIQF
ncbi:DUF3383 family protein [Paenibacillus pini]|uniref:DUF3383 family protein n=1 Tax=Paenibacillus pini JCM 16418 TaxID=1236976 RepID=W7YGU1_9BACL|nr:DUF3383 family protein [Paenibacillus pini]GAF06818.1 hypothetical protein JCM16418_800 [Paenibacillus pini JCM 16418]